MSTRLHIILPEGVVERIDRLRGDVPRSKWIARQLEAATTDGKFGPSLEEVQRFLNEWKPSQALESALDGSSAGSLAATTTRQGRPLPSASTRAPVGSSKRDREDKASLPPVDELLDHAPEIAESLGVSRSEARRAIATGRVTEVPIHSCPVPGCDFSAKSPKAVCGKHSRVVR